MCRWLAYTGSPVLLTNVLYTPVHSLIDQSLHSKLGARRQTATGSVSAGMTPRRPRESSAASQAWNDQNLRELAGHISSHLFFAHIRAAIGSAVQQTNCHPFRHDRWLFMHNGFIDGFAAIKRDLVLAVDESLFPEIKGQADTEVLFYLALTFGLADDPPEHCSRAPSGSSRHAGGSGASPTRSRARSPPVTVRACGCSAIRARGNRGRCSSAATPAQSNGNTRTTCPAAAVRRRPVRGLGAHRRSPRRLGRTARGKLRSGQQGR